MDSIVNEITRNIDEIATSTSLICGPEECSTHITNSQPSLNIMSQNIRSISCNFDSFSKLLQRVVVLPDVIILSECWLSCNRYLPQMVNYGCTASTRLYNQNDGLVIFTKNDLNLTVYEPNFSEANCIIITMNKSTVIIAIYRPPEFKNINNFTNSLDSVLRSLDSFQSIIVMGDTNVNILKDSTDRQVINYLNMLASHGLLPAHTFPTCGNSCLDHVFIKTRLLSKTLVIQNSVTDHYTLIFSLSTLNTTTSSQKNKYFKKINYSGINVQLQSIDFLPVLNENDCDKAANMLLKTVSDVIEANTTIVKFSRRKAPIKPWVTPGLIRSMINRDKLHIKFKNDPEDYITKTTYTRYRNFLTQLLRNLKKQFERSEIEKAKNAKEMWQVINQIGNLKPHKTKSNELLSIASNPQDAANLVNKYFAGVGEALALKVASNTTKIDQSLASKTADTSHPPVDSFLMMETDLTEVVTIINSLKNSTAAGLDDISSRIIKENKVTLAGPLTHICNLSLNSGRFPIAFKTAVIIPIYKNGPKNVLSNYRPISILPAFSKILERIMNNRLTQYLEDRNLLSQQQFGFRKNRSTSDAVSELTNHVAEVLDAGDKCLAIFLDIAKAFDSIPVPRLIKKMGDFGIRGTQHDLYSDYLTNRKQCVKLNDTISDPETVNYGVPQGSIVGPTLFLGYINELCNLTLKNGKIITFADDTALIFHGKSWNDVFANAQNGFNKVNAWLNQNLLSLNADKTKIVTFSILTRTQPPLNSNFNVIAHNRNSNELCLTNQCSCKALERVDTMRYLGVIIDNHLNFSSHIRTLTVRIRKLIAVFKNIRHVADKHVLRTAYYALCQSLIIYCIEAWGGAAKTHLSILEKAQRAILKVSNFLPFRYPTVQLYRDTGVLTVRQLFLLRIILNQHKLCPPVTDNNSKSSLTNRRRRDKVFDLPKSRTHFKNRFSGFLGGFVYNKLSKTVALKQLNYFSLKKTVTKLLQNYSYEETEKLISILK